MIRIKMQNKLQHVSNIISEEGFVNFILKTIKYVNKNIFGILKAYIFEFNLQNPEPQTNCLLKISLKIATEKDIMNLDEELYDYNTNAKKYSQDRLKKGDQCILALHKDKIVGYLWAMADSTMEVGQSKFIDISENRAYLYKAFVLKEYRGMRIYDGMIDYLIKLLKKDGKRYIILTIDSDNKPSLKIKQRKGDQARLIGSIIHIRLFGLKIDYVKKKYRQYLKGKK